MSIWATAPFIRVSLAFMLGICIAFHTSFRIANENLFLLVLLSFFAILVWIKSRFFRKKRSLWGNLLLLIIVFIGMVRYQAYDKREFVATAQFALNQYEAFEGIITSYPTHKPKHTIHKVLLTEGTNDSISHPLEIAIQMFEKRDVSHYSRLKYGDKIRFVGKPRRIGQAKNPHAFDYANYMALDNIYFQIATHSSDIDLIQTHCANSLLSAVYRLRENFEHTIKTHVIAPNERAVVLALLLGIKGELNPETRNAYAASGAMHVLAVSGLHVGIIFLILSAIFERIHSYVFNKYVAPIICILALWGYALLTGFSPSILRAVTMLSIIIFGESLNRGINIYNSLAVAAFLLLIINPSFLFAVGFQLSFLAVIGIVYIYPKLYHLIQSNNWVIDKVWTLSCVSIAAQIATFPLGLYYFHQFPNYFLLSNIPVMSAAFILMILGILLLSIGQFIFGNLIGEIIENIAYWLNTSIRYIQQLDGSLSEWIYLSIVQVILIYLSIVALAKYFACKKMQFAYLTFMIVIIGVVNRSTQIINQSKTKDLVFYALNSTHKMDYINGYNTSLFTLGFNTKSNTHKYQIDPNRLHHLLDKADHFQNIKHDSSAFLTFGQYAVYHGMKVLYIFKPIDFDQIQPYIVCDLLVISNHSIPSMIELTKYIRTQQIILDSTNKNWYIDKIQKEADSLNTSIMESKSKAVVININRSRM